MKKSTENKSVAEHILDFLQNNTETGIDALRLMLTPYPGTYQVAREMRTGKGIRFQTSWSDSYKKTRLLYNTLSRLKKDGLIEKVKLGNGNIWRITKKGLIKNAEWKFRPSNLERVLKSNTRKQPVKITIVSYDIPERQRQERAWVREILKLLDFEMVHKSVWVGRTILPDFLIKEFSRRKIVEHIQIFEVTKQGTLKKAVMHKNK